MKRSIIPGVITFLLLLTQTSFGQNEMPFPKGKPRFEKNRPSVTLPAKFDNNHIYVETIIEGRGPYYFGLDTGSSYTFILPEHAQTLGLKIDRVKDTPAWTYADIPLSYPGLRIDRQRFYTTVGSLPNPHMVGLLGHDFLRQFVVEINYPRQIVILHDSKKFRRPEKGQIDWIVSQLTIIKNAPLVPVRLKYQDGGSENLTALIDTGANVPTTFTAEMIQKINDRSISYISIGGHIIHPIMCCNEVTISPLSRPPFPFDLIMTGNDLKETHLLIDYQNKQLYLRRQ